MSLKSPARSGLPAAQGAVHEGLVGEEVLEAGAETGLVIIPLQTILLCVAHHDKRGRENFYCLGCYLIHISRSQSSSFSKMQSGFVNARNHPMIITF